MANSLSSKKRVRQNKVRQLRNHSRKQRLKTEVRKLNDAIHGGDTDQAGSTLSHVFKLLDQTAAKKVIHKNAASRRKSRLAKQFNKMAASAQS